MHAEPRVPLQDPHAEYSRRLEALRANESQCQRRHRMLGNTNLILAGVAVVVAALALGFRLFSVLWVFLPIVVVIVLAVVNERALAALRKCKLAVSFYERGLARLDQRWMGGGESGERFLDEAHPYSRDLDLFGSGSLFELLSTARTRAGEEMLARWLLEPAAPEEVCARQVAVTELRSRLDLREDLAVLGEDFRSGVHPEALAAWGEGEPLLESLLARIAAPALAVLWILSLAAWSFWEVYYFALLVSMVNLGFTYHFGKRMSRVVSAVEEAGHDLALLSGVLARLERENFTSPKLLELRTALETRGSPPSLWIARLNRLIEFLDSREHLLVRMVDPFVFWTLQLAFAIESWRRQTGPAIRRWLAAVGEMEALSALAGYAYEHPADVFAEFTEASPCFEAAGLAHPLLPEARAVSNHLRLDGESRLLIISGPNMAGKSTLVRAVGLNAVLAQCGAPVRAGRLRLSRLAVAASICVLDSLQGGISRFYAEITRLKQISDLTQGALPVLFLLDELLQGTNSHDRRIGAEAVLKGLVAKGGVGLVTTHDLSLTQIADSMAGRASNFHFEDRLEDGKLCFDYRLHPGIVQTSNALDLMRSIGLDL